MPRIGVSITKSTPFRNSTQEFTNVYYFEIDGGTVTQADASAIIDNLTTQEKTFHSSAVTFVRGRCWSQLGSPGANEMLDQHNLSGVGSQATVTSFDKERAYLFRQRAGVDSRGNPVYLRKWYHSCGNFAPALAPSSTILDNSTGWSSGQRASLVTQLGSIHNLSAGGRTGHLVSKAGRQANVGAPWEAHQYLEHHQLGDMWRAQ
jgi:hypothetical protein